MDIETLLKPYNPWFENGLESLNGLPSFHRPIFKTLIDELTAIPQILSLTGPRRVGKSTLLKQIIRFKLRQGALPQNLIYYQLDDPLLFQAKVDPGQVFANLMDLGRERAKKGDVILFLDEIQRLDRWEMYLKKYYDLKYPVKIIISGSASSPIFKKSRESLIGRIKDFHILTFSFREYALHNLISDEVALKEMTNLYDVGEAAKGMLTGDPRHIDLEKVHIPQMSEDLWSKLTLLFENYVMEGGFPEAWTLPTRESKIEYLFDNQVKKVIYEDLVLATELRKPELLKKFYISLLEAPGTETSPSKIQQETGISVQQIEKYLPLLEMTDLLSHIEKFRNSSMRVRRGFIKFYLVDLALRNAVLRIEKIDDATMGLYAENMVYNALKKWKGNLGLDYYRERQNEIDFILHIGNRKYVLVEVAYKNLIKSEKVRFLRRFAKKVKSNRPFVVTKNRTDFGAADNQEFRIPLIQFLVMID